jgi:hypothetical protein
MDSNVAPFLIGAAILLVVVIGLAIGIQARRRRD